MNTATATAEKKFSELGKDMAMTTRGTAVVPMPTTQAQLVEFSQLMSRGGPMVGKPFREAPGACLGIITQAMRWGMDPFSCSQKAYLVNDVVGYEAQLVHAVILKNAPLTRRPRATYSGEGDARRCKVLFYVEGEEEPFEYESPRKVDIKPQNSPLWKSDPDQQLWYYSVRAGCRRHFPEVIMGVYTPEEMSAGVDESGRPISEPTTVTLMGDSVSQDAAAPEDVREAEFTDVGAQLQRNAEKAAAQPKTATPPKKKGSGKAAGDGGVSSREDAEKDTPAAAKADPETKAAAARGDDDRSRTQETRQADTSAEPDTATDEEDDGSAEDEALVAEIEAKLDPGKALSSRKVVNEHRGVLARIAETGGEALAARAEKILVDWPAK